MVALTVEGQSFPTLTADGLFLDVLTIDVLSLVNFQNISDISRLEDYKEQVFPVKKFFRSGNAVKIS